MKTLNRFTKLFKKAATSHQLMLEPVQFLDETSKNFISKQYNQYKVPELSYATVTDFCDSADHLPQICYLNGDLKNVQRPWTVKAILGQVPLGSRLIEIGAGVPLVAGMLAELGYQVTVIDPYEGAGNGPTEYTNYTQQFPNVTIVKNSFGIDLEGIVKSSVDCIYSVSVLEHIPKAEIKQLYKAIHKFLRPRGFSIHCVDHVIQGIGSEDHEDRLKVILDQQKKLKSSDCSPNEGEYDEMLSHLKDDLETFYLSALGHHLWRGGCPYAEFPFRKVVSIQTCIRMS